MISSMLLKKVLAFLLTACLFSRRCESVLHREPSHNMPTLIESLNKISIWQTGFIGNSTKNITEYMNDGYIISEIKGFSDRQSPSKPYRLARLRLKFITLDDSKPPIIQNIGKGYAGFCSQQYANLFKLNFPRYRINSIQIGFEGNIITNLYFVTKQCYTSLGAYTKNTTKFYINGVLVGIQAKVGAAGIQAINFKYKQYSRKTQIDRLPIKTTGIAQLNSSSSAGGTQSDYFNEYYYVSSFKGFLDRQFYFDTWTLSILYIGVSQIGEETQLRQSSYGTGYYNKPISKLLPTDVIKIDYVTTIVKKITIGFDQNALASIQVITSDGISQTLGHPTTYENMTYTTFDINGYLMGYTIRAEARINSIQFKYKQVV